MHASPDAVDVFHGTNGKNPKAIVVFRDGVGEGQEVFVKQHEVPAIKVLESSRHTGVFLEVICLTAIFN